MKTYIQKLIFIVIFPLFMASFLTPANSYALAPLDQKCITEGDGNGLVGYVNVTGVDPDYQAFVPTKNTLDAITVRIKVTQTTYVRADIIDFLTPPYSTIASQTKRVDPGENWITFDYPDKPMPLSGYVIALSNAQPDMQFFWKYRTDGCYDRGYAIVNGSYAADWDFGFSVYAYDSDTSSGNVSSSQPSGNPPNGNPATGGSASAKSPIGTVAGTLQPPATQTSSAIFPPTNLTAKDAELDYGGAIDLAWTASTSSDIDGYKVFRRAEGDPEYIEIIRLPKTFTKFTDPWATKDKTFYYKIRAYKGNQESADSNVVSATSIDDLSGMIQDIQDDFKKNSKGGILGESGLFIIIPIVIVLLIIGLFILGLWVLLHKKKPPTNTPPPTDNQKK